MLISYLAVMPMGGDFYKHYAQLVQDEKEKVQQLEAKYAEKMKQINVRKNYFVYRLF